MSRFEETLQRDLRQIADRATPSPDAWAQIQSRIADQDPIQETEIIMLTENTFTTRRWPVVAAAAAVAALAIGAIALVNRGDDGDVPADVPTPTVAPSPDSEGADELTTDGQQQIDDGVASLPTEGVLTPGRYSTGMLGVPVEFDLPDSTLGTWSVGLDRQAEFMIRNDGGFVAMTRVGSFYDAVQAQDPDVSGLGHIPPNDIDGWIDTNGIVVDDTAETMVGGRDAQFRLVRAPAGSGAGLCPADAQPCIQMGSGSADQLDSRPGPVAVLSRAELNAFWLVDMDDYEPLRIWAQAFDIDMNAWLAEIQPLIDSIVLGEPAPATEFGAARLSTFDADSGTLELPGAGATLSPGRYASDSLGVAIEFGLEVGQTASWSLAIDEPGQLRIK